MQYQIKMIHNLFNLRNLWCNKFATLDSSRKVERGVCANCYIIAIINISRIRDLENFSKHANIELLRIGEKFLQGKNLLLILANS